MAEVALPYGPLERAPRGADAPDVAHQVAWLSSGRTAAPQLPTTARFESPPEVDWSAEGPTQTLRVRSTVAPPRDDATYYRVSCQLRRHLRDARKPLMVVAAESADHEQLQQAITAFGGSPALQEAANLVLVLTGSPPPEADEDRGTRVKQLLLAIDRHDLYGLVALYAPQDDLETTELLRIGRDRRGVLLGVASARAASQASPLELLASDLGIPVIDADSGDLADLCGPVLVDPESWTELSRESGQEAAPCLAAGNASEASSLGRRLLESHRRRGWRVPTGRLSVVAGNRTAAAG